MAQSGTRENVEGVQTVADTTLEPGIGRKDVAHMAPDMVLETEKRLQRVVDTAVDTVVAGIREADSSRLEAVVCIAVDRSSFLEAVVGTCQLVASVDSMPSPSWYNVLHAVVMRERRMKENIIHAIQLLHTCVG